LENTGIEVKFWKVSAEEIKEAKKLCMSAFQFQPVVVEEATKYYDDSPIARWMDGIIVD